MRLRTDPSKQAQDVADALPEGARWALMALYGPIAALRPEDWACGVNWGVVVRDGAYVRPTDLGREVLRLWRAAA